MRQVPHTETRTEGTDNQTDRGHTQWGTLSTVHTEGTDNQTDRDTLGHCICYLQRALATSRGWGGLGTEGRDNQTDRGILGYCLLYIERALTTNCGERRQGPEGKDNQTDREHRQWSTLGHWTHLECCQLYIQRAQTTS